MKFSTSARWLLGLLLLMSCTYQDLNLRFDCSKSDLSLTLDSKVDASTCHSIDGSITVEPKGGTAPYNYSIDGTNFQTNTVFPNLAPGNYILTVRDFHNCTNQLLVDVGAANSTLNASGTATPDTGCLTNNGTITITPTGGTSPYLFKLDNTSFVASGDFTGLANGQHVVWVKDADDCEHTVNIIVPHGDTGISYASQIVPIINASCALPNCHDAGSGSRDWTKLSNVQAKAQQIKLRTGNKTMPIGTGPSLSDDQISQIACWVDDGAKNN